MRKKLFELPSRKDVTQVIQQSGLTSPIGQSTQLNNLNDNTLVQAINRKFSHFMEHHKIKKLTQKFKVQRGRNNAINYEQKYQFKQQWQLTEKSPFTLHYNYFFPEQYIYKFLNLIMLLLSSVLVWILSIFRLFSYLQNKWIFGYCLSITILDSCLKGFFIINFLYDQKIKTQHKKIQKKKYFKSYVGNVFSFVYSILGLAQVIHNASNDNFLVLDVICIFFIYIRCQEIYQHFKMVFICSKHKAYMKIFDLMSNLFLLTHVFGILIYAVSRINPHQTYLSYAEIKGPLSWFQKYIYSIYFSSTTMLTVGYGDLLPANIQQIAIVLIMQLFGIVMIGYINGEVGDVLCTLRREKQNLQNDLTNAEKLSKSFKLTQQTSQKIREYLIDNRRVQQQLNIQDQNNLLTKISDQLRHQANYTNHINIIKQSLFFIYNFSKKSQIQVSNKLIKMVFSPNQNLPQIIGKQKIYLLSKGEIAIYISKKNKKAKNGRKVLKNISKTEQKQFKYNSYGHTALILGRPTLLKAYAKDFAICHSLDRHEFIQALSLDSNDWESFHQMRSKYQANKHPQKEEVPQFYSIRQHFNPNRTFLIQKYLKNNHKTKRKQWIRHRQRCRTIHEALMTDQILIDNAIQQVLSESSSSISSVQNEKNAELDECLSSKQRQNKYKNMSLGLLTNLNIRSRGYQQKYGNKKYLEKKAQLVNRFKSQQFQQPMEVLKEYQNFFKHSNVSNIIKKSAHQNNVLQFVSSFIQLMPTFQDQIMNESQKEAKLFRHRRMLKSLPF